MHLVAPLACGIVGAENGVAFIRQRGTSTLATVYEAFTGSIMIQPTTGLVLDDNGGLEVYVNELVDVEVQDTEGNPVRSFVAGDASSAIEVRSQSFTGTDYDTALRGAGSPTTEQAVLDLWYTQNGSTDWRVLLGGSPVTIQAAVASIYGIFINVKDPTYGAKGDGTTDDTTAIQAALTAATTPKSIVFFPAGTYRITTKLTVPVGVSLWGVGAEGSKIAMDHASNDTLEYGSGTSVTYQEIRGLGIGAAQTNTGKPIDMTSGGARKLMLVNSVVNSSLNYTGTIVTVAGSNNTFFMDSSALYPNGTAAYGINAQSDSAVVIRASSITSAVALYTGALVISSILTISDSSFVSTGTSAGAGTSYCVRVYNGTQQWVRVVNSFFITTTNGPIALSAVNSNSAACLFSETGNTFTGFTAIYSGLVAGSNRPQIRLSGREQRIQNLSDDSATVNISGGAYGTVFLTRTAAGGAQTITDTVGAPEGAYLTVLVYNNSGGALGGAVNFNGSGFLTTSATVNPANTKTSIYNFRMVVSGGNGVWVPTGTAITTT